MKRIVLTLVLLCAAAQLQAFSFGVFSPEQVAKAKELEKVNGGSSVEKFFKELVTPKVAAPATSGSDFSQVYASVKETVVTFAKDNKYPLACVAAAATLVVAYKLYTSYVKQPVPVK